MILDEIVVSRFKNYRSNTPTFNVNLWEWLKDDSWKADIEYLRTLNDKENIGIIKAGLPCITPSGTFSKRNLSGLIKHSGIICLDIDADHNPHITDFEQQRDELCNLVNVAYCSLSASGRGVFCLIPIQYPERHKQHFEALKLNFESQGIIIDKSCGDITRLRGYSYDSEAYINLNAVPYKSTLDFTLQTFQQERWPEVWPTYYNNNNAETLVGTILYKIEASAIDITETYEQWFQISCALANEFGEYGREIFHRVSRYYTKYNANETNKMFNSCLNGGYRYTLGTFFYWAEQYNLK